MATPQHQAEHSGGRRWGTQSFYVMTVAVTSYETNVSNLASEATKLHQQYSAKMIDITAQIWPAFDC